MTEDIILSLSIQEYQKDPITSEIIHVDLMLAQNGVEAKYSVKVRIVGIAKGLKNKGVLMVSKKRIKVKAAPEKLPKDYEINYSQGALKAYCDMVVNDKSFLETISNLPQNIIKKIKKDLNPLKNIYDSTYPHEDFVKAIKSSAKRAKLNTNEGFNKFLEEIKCKKM